MDSHQMVQAVEDSPQPCICRSRTAIEPRMQQFQERLQPLEEPPPVRRTFIHFQLPCPSSAMRRSHSQPCNEWMVDSARSLTESLPRHTQSDSCLHKRGELAPKPGLPHQNQEERVHLWCDEPLSEDEECILPPPTPSPRYPDVGNKGRSWDGACPSRRHAAVQARVRENCDASERHSSRAGLEVAAHEDSMPSCRRQLVCPEDQDSTHKKVCSARPFPLSTPSPSYGSTVAFQWVPISSPEKSTPTNADGTLTSNSLHCTQLCHDEPPRFPRFTMPIGSKEAWTPVGTRANSKAAMQQPSCMQAFMQSRGPSEAAQVLKLACIV